jgi:hypothetical protein
VGRGAESKNSKNLRNLRNLRANKKNAVTSLDIRLQTSEVVETDSEMTNFGICGVTHNMM